MPCITDVINMSSIIRHRKLKLPQIFKWKIDINTTFLVLHGLSYLFTRYYYYSSLKIKLSGQQC